MALAANELSPLAPLLNIVDQASLVALLSSAVPAPKNALSMSLPALIW